MVHCHCCKTGILCCDFCSSSIIAGLRFIYTFLCAILCECTSNEDTVELKSYMQLFVDIGLKMASIAPKLMTYSSSGRSTYLKIGIRVDSIGFHAAYFFFDHDATKGDSSVQSCVYCCTASLGCSEGREQGSGSRCNKVLGWLNKYMSLTSMSLSSSTC